MIITIILIEILLFIVMVTLSIYAENNFSNLAAVSGIILLILLLVVPIAVGTLHGYVDYKESNDKDLARITAVTQEQTAFRTFYRVKDTFYCYYEDKELKEN